MSVELDLYQAMGDNIISIAHANSDFICTQCLRVASNLFSILEAYCTEDYRNEIAEKFEEITGRNIRDI